MNWLDIPFMHYLGVPRIFRYPVILLGMLGLWAASTSSGALGWRIFYLLTWSTMVTLFAADLYRASAYGTLLQRFGVPEDDERRLYATSNFFNMLHLGGRLTGILLALLFILEKIQSRGLLVASALVLGILSVYLLDLNGND